MWLLILKSIYLILPGIFANATPVLARGIFKFLDYPVDFNKKAWDGEPILGTHKTWRGLILGILVAIGIVAIQKNLMNNEVLENFSIFPYREHSSWLVGFLIGFGVLFGDIFKSFFKRRYKIKPGDKFIPWDQIDAVLGGLIFISFIWIPPWQLVVTLIILSFCLHIIIRHLGHYLRVNKSKW